MAIISKPHLFRLSSFNADKYGEGVKVGNNRTVEHLVIDGVRTIVGRLHGHAIFILEDWDKGLERVTLDHRGYMTTTTREAMKDFLRAAQIDGAVSFANGIFTARIGECGRITDGRSFTVLMDGLVQ